MFEMSFPFFYLKKKKKTVKFWYLEHFLSVNGLQCNERGVTICTSKLYVFGQLSHSSKDLNFQILMSSHVTVNHIRFKEHSVN